MFLPISEGNKICFIVSAKSTNMVAINCFPKNLPSFQAWEEKRGEGKKIFIRRGQAGLREGGDWNPLRNYDLFSLLELI